MLQSCFHLSVNLSPCLQSLKCFFKRFKKTTRLLLLGKLSRRWTGSIARQTSEGLLKTVTSIKISVVSSTRRVNRFLTADLLSNGRCLSVGVVRETDGSAAWQQAFKNTDMKQARAQSLPIALMLAAPKTMTNLIPDHIILCLFCSENMNLCRGRTRGGDLTNDWAKDGVEGRMMDSVYLCVCAREIP